MCIIIVRRKQPSKCVLQNSCCALVVSNFEIRMSRSQFFSKIVWCKSSAENVIAEHLF